MFRHTFALSCFILFSPQFLHTAARPLLPSIDRTGEPHRRPVEINHATFEIGSVPLKEGLTLSLKMISQNLDVCAKMKAFLPATNNRFCPVHGLFEKPRRKDHEFTPTARIKMSLKKVTSANAQAWIAEGHSAEARKTRTVVITVLGILGYHEETKVLVQKVFSHIWSCTEEAE